MFVDAAAPVPTITEYSTGLNAISTPASITAGPEGNLKVRGGKRTR